MLIIIIRYFLSQVQVVLKIASLKLIDYMLKMEMKVI
jgi:hypothetical protein